MRPGYMQPGYPQPGYPQPGYPQPTSRPGADDRGVSSWQETAGTGQLVAETAGRESQIFGKKKNEKAETPGNSFVSRIFGRNRREEYDGLVGGDTAPMEPVQQPRKTTGRRTATGADASPVTEWER